MLYLGFILGLQNMKCNANSVFLQGGTKRLQSCHMIGTSAAAASCH